MQILRDRDSIDALSNSTLRTMIEDRVAALGDFDDMELHELVTFLVVDAGDSLAAVDAALGFPIRGRPFELIEEHADWFEIVFVVSDDGFGIEVFIPKSLAIDPALLTFCTNHITSSKELPD